MTTSATLMELQKKTQETTNDPSELDGRILTYPKNMAVELDPPEIVYPTGISLHLITIALSLACFLVSLVCIAISLGIKFLEYQN
jgi:hypothetical protein